MSEKMRKNRDDDEDDRERGSARERSRSPINAKSHSAAADPGRRKQTAVGIQIKLGDAQRKLTKPKVAVSSIFNQESDEEPEMPPEAKMRMRNIGRDTPTSAGPNSFGKTKHGFCDAKKVFEKNLKEAMSESSKAE